MTVRHCMEELSNDDIIMEGEDCMVDMGSDLFLLYFMNLYVPSEDVKQTSMYKTLHQNVGK